MELIFSRFAINRSFTGVFDGLKQEEELRCRISSLS